MSTVYKEIKVLDFGYVRLVEAWGHGDAGVDSIILNWDSQKITTDFECGIIEAARQSTQANFRGWDDKPCPTCSASPIAYKSFHGEECSECNGKGYLPGDQRLLSYLFNNKPQHATPFEFAGMILEVEDPTCVLWEWVRHRTCSIEDGTFTGDMGYNIMSSRYGPIPSKDYMPMKERLFQFQLINKQAGALKGSDVLTDAAAESWLRQLKHLYETSEQTYQMGLTYGVPKEIARLALTFGRYWRMRVKADLRNWLAFCTLRSDPMAMWEIQCFANAVGEVLSQQFPRTWGLYLANRNK